ncbi:MAG: NAD-dependent epimerase/dehydratase family protein, partial [Leptospiraceae bacterium]|nr:NAD-dependent epimerase/dehydratase family protein [Leptospiraceae bacterium]
NSLLSGKLEQSNEPYAISKIASIKLCDSYNRQYNTNFNSLIVTNLYGPGDNYNLETAHVLPALIRKFHEAKMKNTEVVLWGTGNARREFMYVDDLADAAVFLMDNNRIDRDHGTINVGCGEDISIKNLAELIKEIIGFTGNIRWDSTKPDGMPRKLLEVTQLNKLGWKHSIALEDGIRKSYDWFLDNTAHLKQS